MFVGWEGVGVCSYLLVNFWFTRIAANQSSISAFLTNRVGDCLLTIGMFTILWSVGNKNKMLRFSSACGPTGATLLDEGALRARKYSTLRSGLINNPYFVTGFVEGESCFSIGIIKSSKMKLGWSVELKFFLNSQDPYLLELIKAYFCGCGVIREDRIGKFIYSVISLTDLAIILNHFNKYPPITPELAKDFIIFKRAYEIVKDGKPLIIEDLKEVLSLKVSIDKGASLSEELNTYLTNGLLQSGPTLKMEVDQKIKDLNWISGFVSKRGRFIVDIVYSDADNKILKQINLKFQISLNTINEVFLVDDLSSYLGSGVFYSRAERKTGDFRLQKTNDIFNIIIPLFKEYPLQGAKAKDFFNFCRIAELIKDKAHRTASGLEEIVKIKSSIGQGRSLPLYEENIVSANGSNLNKGLINKLPLPASVNNTNNGQGLKVSDFAPYLAGLIEGDGHIAVHDKNSKSKIYRPKIIIAFNIHDKPLAEKISVLLKVGKIISKPEAGHVLLQILAKEEVIKIIQLINGYMRTPKVEALHRAIIWINEQDKSDIPCLGLDSSPLDSNSWLTGFSDADGSFGLILYNRKNKASLKTVVQTTFRIEVKQNYSREVTPDQGGSSYFDILTKIAAFFDVNLYTRTREREGKVYYAFVAVSATSRSLKIVRKYFEDFPLYSSKYLAYKDWCLVQDLRKESLSEENLNKIKRIKDQFNSKRKVFNFSHLDNLHFK